MAKLNKEFLEKFGLASIDRSNQWMIESSNKTANFFKWLQDEIDETTVLTLLEVKEYDDLSQTGLLSEQEAEKQYKQIENEHAGIFFHTEEDLKVAEDEFLNIKSIQEEKNILLETLSSLEKNQLFTLSKLEIRKENGAQELETISKECIKLAEEVQFLKEKNHSLFNDLQIYFKSPCLYMHQMPFYVCDNNINQFMSKLELHLNNNQILTDSRIVESSYESKLVELQKAKDFLVEAWKTEMETELHWRAMRNVVAKINSTVCTPRNNNQLMQTISTYESANEASMLLVERLKEEYVSLMDQLVLAEIELLSEKDVKNKQQRAQQRVKNIKLLLPLIEKCVSIGDVIWFGLCLDYEKFDKRLNDTDLSEAYQTMLRIESMKRLVDSRFVPKDIRKGEEKVLQLLKSISNTDATQLHEILHNFAKYNEELEKNLKLVREGIQYKNVQKLFANIELCEQFLQKFVYGGPTSQPKLFDPRFQYTIQTSIEQNSAIERKIKTLRSNFKEEIVEKMARDKYYRYLQNLWIWFLTEPKKVLRAIAEIKESATKERSMHLSGLRRKE